MKTLLSISSLLVILGLPAPLLASESPETLFSLPMDSFKPSGRNDAQRLYLAPGAQLNRYHAVVLEPLYFIRQQGEGNWELLQGAEKNAITRYFQTVMTRELQKAGMAVADAPGDNVMRLRVAITGLDPEKPGMSALDILPAKAIINLTRLAAGKERYLVKVASMAQLEDSQSGALLAGSVNLRHSSKTLQKNQPLELSTLQGMIDIWCRDSAAQIARATAMESSVSPH